MGKLRLENEVAYITGAGSGIGRTSAILFAREGANVICADFDRESAQKTAEEITNEGGDAIASYVDIGDSDAVDKSISESVARYGTITILLAAAGCGSFESWDNLNNEEWDRMIRINLTSGYYLLRAVHPIMKESKKGSIILVSSTAAYSGGTGMNPAYNCAKAGLHALSRHCSVKWAGEGIRVNTLMPSWVVTNFNKQAKETDGVTFDEKENADWYAKGSAGFPMGRPAKSDELANAALFLASEEASYVSGINLLVSGARYVFNQ